MEQQRIRVVVGEGRAQRQGLLSFVLEGEGMQVVATATTCAELAATLVEHRPDVVVILRKQRQDLRAMEIVTRTTQDTDPPWTFRAIHMHFVLTGRVDPAKAERAVDLAESKYCSVAATLRDVVSLTHSIEVADGSS